MILLIGSDAYSPFRMDAIKDAVAKLDPAAGPVEIDAKWVYALETNGEAFDPEELKRAATLLNAEGECGAADFFVTPRRGTISPWSTKATDIFRNCGLKSIKRVERGIRYIVNGGIRPVAKSAGELYEDGSEDAEQEAVFTAPKWVSAIYDKMTEGVYANLDGFFDVADPRPGRTYDVLAKGVEAIR